MLKHRKKSGLKKFTIEHIRSWNPCYDPTRHLEETFKGSAIDILNNEKIPIADRFWVVLRTEILSEKLMRLFAVWSYRQTLNFIKNPDPRSIEAANIAEAFALGNANEIQLSLAHSAAHSARSAADSAAYSAARSAAYSAARSAAYSAAHSAADSAAYSAAHSARSAAYSAADSARSAAYSAAYSCQKEKLIEMILIEAKERIKK